MALTGTRIRKGDTVRVLIGKDKGKEGKVLRAILPVEDSKKRRPARLVIEGINTVIKHQRARQQQNPSPGSPRPESGRIEIDAPIYASKVQLVCPNCAKPTRIGMTITAEGERYRSCKHCSKKID